MSSGKRGKRPKRTDEPVSRDSGSSSGGEERHSDDSLADETHYLDHGHPEEDLHSNPSVSAGMGDVMSKLLRTNAPAEPILSKRRAVERRLEEEALERRARALVRQEAKEARDAAHTIPSLDNNEKELRKVATRGVVQLFNAIHRHQVARERRLREAKDKGQHPKNTDKSRTTGTETGTASGLKAVSKASFLELLKMGGGQHRSTVQ